MEHAAISHLQALYRGHRTRARVWHEPKAAYVALAARIDSECGFGSSSSSALGPSPSDQVRLDVGQQGGVGPGTICPAGFEEACERSETTEKTCLSASLADPDKCISQSTPPVTASTRSIPPVHPAPTHRRREDILMELQWVNASLRERLKILRLQKKQEACGRPAVSMIKTTTSTRPEAQSPQPINKQKASSK